MDPRTSFGREPLRTARLLLRLPCAADAPFLVELLTDPQFVRMIGDRGVRTTAEARTFLERNIWPSYREHGFGPLLIEWHGASPAAKRGRGDVVRGSSSGRRCMAAHAAGAEDAPLIGLCGLYQRTWLAVPDLGYALLPAWRGRGLARESAAALLDHARDALGLREVVGLVHRDNDASTRVLRACGLHRALTLRSPVTGEVTDLFVPPATLARARHLLRCEVEVLETPTV